MDKLAFNPVIDLPLSLLTTLAFVLHFNAWAKNRPSDINVDLQSRLPTARVRVVVLLISIVGVCWFANLSVWAIYALLLLLGLGIAMLMGDGGDGSGLVFIFIAFLIREWAFGFPIMILKSPQEGGMKDLAETHGKLIGVHGTATTHLRPFGEASIDGQSISVVSETGELIEAGAAIIVTDAKGNRICVRSIAYAEEGKQRT